MSFCGSGSINASSYRARLEDANSSLFSVLHIQN
jgi:hypothetical protein